MVFPVFSYEMTDSEKNDLSYFCVELQSEGF